MKKVKLGRLQVQDFVVEKPVGIRENGTLVYPKEILSKAEPPSFGVSLASRDNQAKLAIERLKVEPDFTWGILDTGGNYTKDDVMKNIANQTPLGQEFAAIENRYAEYFTQQLLGRPVFDHVDFTSMMIPEKMTIAKDWKAISQLQVRFFKSSVLFCENTTDAVTNQAATYRIANVHSVFAAKGFNVIKLDGADDIRTNFVTHAQNSKTVYISGIGHGNYNVYTGHNSNHILEAGTYNLNEVKGKVLHFLSCRTARDLGPDTIVKGAKGYVGYTENFVFDWANSTLYWKCDSQFDISMANGKTVEQAIADTYAQYDAAIASVPGTNTAATLFSDRNLLRSPVSGTSWGAKNAVIHSSILPYMTLAQFAAR